MQFINSNLSTNTNLLIPRSNLASNDLENGLKEYGFEVKSWIGYENAPKSVENLSINPMMFCFFPHPHLPYLGLKWIGCARTNSLHGN